MDLWSIQTINIAMTSLMIQSHILFFKFLVIILKQCFSFKFHFFIFTDQKIQPSVVSYVIILFSILREPHDS